MSSANKTGQPAHRPISAAAYEAARVFVVELEPLSESERRRLITRVVDVTARTARSAA